MFRCTLRDLFWLLLLSAVVSGWYAQARARVNRQKSMEQRIAKEQQEIYQRDKEYNQWQERQGQEINNWGRERFRAYDMHGVALNQYLAVRGRLAALGVELPNQIYGWEGNAHGVGLMPEEEQDLEKAKQEYERLRKAKFGDGED